MRHESKIRCYWWLGYLIKSVTILGTCSWLIQKLYSKKITLQPYKPGCTELLSINRKAHHTNQNRYSVVENITRKNEGSPLKTSSGPMCTAQPADCAQVDDIMSHRRMSLKGPVRLLSDYYSLTMIFFNTIYSNSKIVRLTQFHQTI